MKISKVPINEIKVGVRRRVDMGDMEKLQLSIERVGLLNPIIVEDDYTLVAGYRRLTCCKALSHKEIYATLKKDLDDIQKKELELEENIHEELTWDEEAMLRADIHKLKQEIYGKPVKGHKVKSWTLEDTAESLGLSLGTLSQDIMISDALEKYPNLAKFTSKRQALKTLTKAKETAILTELAKRDAVKSSKTQETPYFLHNGDAYEYLVNKVEEEVIDLVLFDPPWGVDIDIIGSSRGLGGEKTSYKDDSFVSAKAFTEKMLPEIYRVMKPDTHLYMFVGVEFAEYWKSFLSNIKTFFEPGKEPKWGTLQEGREWSFNVRALPLIWVKEGGGYTDFEVRFMPRYEMILFCNKGLRRLNSVCSDVLEFKRPLSVDRIHTQQKSLELLQQLIRLSSQHNELILDPCAGSFATIRAATLMGRRSIGIDDDVDVYNKGLEWLKGVEFGSATESLNEDKEDA